MASKINTLPSPLTTARAALGRRADPRTPHPSWRQTIAGTDQGADRVINARDFWARLGI